MHALLALVVTAGLGQPPVFEPRRLAFAPDDRALAVGYRAPNGAGELAVYDLATRTPRWRIDFKHPVSGLAWSGDGKTLFAAAGDSVEVVDPVSGKSVRRLGPHPKTIGCLALSADGTLLATGADDRAVTVWDVAGGKEHKRLTEHPDRVWGLAFSPDGKQLASAAGREARVWDLGAGKVVHKLTHGNFLVAAVAFVDGGKVLLTGGWDGRIRLWEADTGKRRTTLQGSGGVDGVALHPGTGMMAVRGTGRLLYLFDLNLNPPDKKTEAAIEKHLTELDHDDYAVRESASKKLVALGFVAEPALRKASRESPSAEVRIRCRQALAELTSEPRRTLRGHRGDLRWLAFTADGKTLVSAAADGTVRLWNPATGEETAQLPR